MAKKKNARAAKTKKSGSAKKADFGGKYIELRTILDSIEMGSLRFLLTASTPEERLKRANKLIGKLLPIAEKISHLIEPEVPASAVREAASGDGDQEWCPDGYWLCSGVCVPYPCPDSATASNS